ncbi:hypothetical protein M8494_18475 [Serratia ureilytica]
MAFGLPAAGRAQVKLYDGAWSEWGQLSGKQPIAQDCLIRSTTICAALLHGGRRPILGAVQHHAELAKESGRRWGPAAPPGGKPAAVRTRIAWTQHSPPPTRRSGCGR